MNEIATFFLSFINASVLIPLIIGGYIWLGRPLFFHALCLLLLSILFNYALKITFQIPFSPTLGKPGFAFPSGHMHAAVAFYGWLMHRASNSLGRAALVGLLAGIGFSLFYRGYHNYIDIIGALFFGTFLLSAYIALDQKQQGLRWFVISFSSMLMIYIALQHSLIDYLWIVYFLLLAITLSEKPLAPRTSLNLYSKGLATILCLLMIFLLNTPFSTQLFQYLPEPLQHLQTATFGIALLGSVYLGSLIENYINKKRF